jgi:hypothetical protein
MYNIKQLPLREILTVQGHKPYYIERHLWKYYYCLTKVLNKYARHAHQRGLLPRILGGIEKQLGKIQVKW